MKHGKLRKWNFNFRRTLSAAWIRWDHIASFSLFLTEERLLWKLTRRETGGHSSKYKVHPRESWLLDRTLWIPDFMLRSRMAGTGSSIPCPWNVDFRFQSLARFRASYEQAPAVKKVDNDIHRIKLYPVDRSIGFSNTYPVDSAIHLMNNRLWIPNLKPLNWFRISLQKKIPRFRNPDYRTPRISITDSILQCGTRNKARKQDMIPWLPRWLSLEVLSSETHTLHLPPRYT